MVDHTPDSELTIEQKAALGSGAAFWITEPLGKTGAVLLADGPHGVRRQIGAADHAGIAPSLPATCFPPAVALAQSWDVAAVERVGAALGREARSLGVDVLLGPGINIKRDPRCGRNFEYYSEDPLLSGELGSAWVRGVQGQGVAASVKHFAANNQEHERMRVSADIDERPLREIYLRAFERVVKSAQPWTVMASYNRVNGVPMTQNRRLLTEVLRAEWGFDGVVVSDWGAVSDRVAALAAGLDLQMPGGDPEPDAEVVAAVACGQLAQDVVDRSVERLLDLAHRVGNERRPTADVEYERHHVLAREIAGKCVVLLKNEAATLPITTSETIAVVGRFAAEPRYQGGGSSRVNASRVDVPLQEIRALASGATVTYAPGFASPGETSDAEVLRDEAVALARAADVAVVFLGLPESEEVEGIDRPGIDLPAAQVELLRSVVAAQPRTVVVLSHGGILGLRPIADLVPALVDAALLGQAGGGAVADVLFGVVNPSGRLAETVPLRLQDVPSYLGYPGENRHVRYGEGLFVGYRGYDARRLGVQFPFGHGLSYTAFDYSDLAVSADETGVGVSVTVANVGEADGREVVQFYVSGPGGVVRPPWELKGFQTVAIQAGRSARIELTITREDLAYWETRAGRWVVEAGEYRIAAAASSRDFRAISTVSVTGDSVAVPLTLDSSIAEVMADPTAGPAVSALLAPLRSAESAAEKELGTDTARAVAAMPIGRIRSLAGGRGPGREQLEALLREANSVREGVENYIL